jgi:hypothetical protein
LFNKEFPLSDKDIWEHYKFEMDEKVFQNNIGLIKARKYIEDTKRNNNTYFITDEGFKKVKEYFDTYVKEVAENKFKEVVESRNLVLQHDILKIEKQSRAEISKLTIENLTLQNKKLKRETIIFVVGLLVGGLFSNLSDILKYGSSHFQTKCEEQVKQKPENYHKLEATEKTYPSNKPMEETKMKKKDTAP